MAAEGLECPICLTLPESRTSATRHCYCVLLGSLGAAPLPRVPSVDTLANRTVRLAACGACVELRALRRGHDARRESGPPSRLPAGAHRLCGGCGWLQLGRGDVGAGSPRGSLPLCDLPADDGAAAGTEPAAAGTEPGAAAEGGGPAAAGGPGAGARGFGTEEGGRRQRQRVGPAPHDAPPSNAAVEQSGVVDGGGASDARDSGTGGGEACERLAF